MTEAERDRLEGGAIEMPGSVREIQSEDRSTGEWIFDRRTVSGERGHDEDPVAAGRDCLGQLGERPVVKAGEHRDPFAQRGGRAGARRRGRCLGQDRSDRQGQRKGEKMTLQGGWQHVRFHTIKVSIRSIMNSVSS